MANNGKNGSPLFMNEEQFRRNGWPFGSDMREDREHRYDDDDNDRDSSSQRMREDTGFRDHRSAEDRYGVHEYGDRSMVAPDAGGYGDDQRMGHRDDPQRWRQAEDVRGVGNRSGGMNQGYGGSGQDHRYGGGTNQGYGSGMNQGYRNTQTGAGYGLPYDERVHHGPSTSHGVRPYQGQAPMGMNRGPGGFSMNQGGMNPGHGGMHQGAGGHRGKGPRNFVRSDERIREAVCEVLEHDDHIDASDIEITVQGGEVTLTGTVEDRQTKRYAEDCIEHVTGVREIHNHLRTRQSWFRRGIGGLSDMVSTATSSRTHGSDEVEQLNSFLRGEISAVETYRLALEKLDRNSAARRELEECKRSHEERVNLLRQHIRSLGAEPSTSSGPWGVFAKVVERGATALGDKAAIGALEEGEDHGLRDYRGDLDKLSPHSRMLIHKLLASQEDTHRRLSALKHRN